MMFRGVKPILGLIVLLAWPCLGLGSRVEAGFALERSTLTPERSSGSLGFEFQLVLNGDEPTEPDRSCSTTATTKEPTPITPGDSPREPGRPLDILLLPGNLANGTSCAGSPSTTGPGSGLSLSFILPSGIGMPNDSASGRRYLADDRLDPPPFATRFFRPPRVV